MGSESSLTWYPLKRELKKLGWHHQRFEDKLSLGIPDVNIYIPEFGIGDVWLELKYVAGPGSSVDIGLRPEQYIWLRDGSKAGRLVYLVARVGDVWCLWSDAESWRLAKHPAPWLKMRSRAKLFHGPAELLRFLASV